MEWKDRFLDLREKRRLAVRSTWIGFLLSVCACVFCLVSAFLHSVQGNHVFVILFCILHAINGMFAVYDGFWLYREHRVWKALEQGYKEIIKKTEEEDYERNTENNGE